MDLNPEIFTSLENDTIRGMLLVLEGMTQLAAVEGFDELVTILQTATDHLVSIVYPQEQEEVSYGLHSTSHEQSDL